MALSLGVGFFANGHRFSPGMPRLVRPSDYFHLGISPLHSHFSLVLLVPGYRQVVVAASTPTERQALYITCGSLDVKSVGTQAPDDRC